MRVKQDAGVPWLVEVNQIVCDGVDLVLLALDDERDRREDEPDDDLRIPAVSKLETVSVTENAADSVISAILSELSTKPTTWPNTVL